MNEQRLQLRQQSNVRRFLRIGGVLIAVTGLVFLVVGVASFFMSLGRFEPPRYFWCAFVGMPLLFCGIVMLGWGFLGAVQRYAAGESAPVGKDLINYLGENTHPGLTAAASAVREGLSGTSAASPRSSEDA